jgi:hypothetical protein
MFNTGPVPLTLAPSCGPGRAPSGGQTRSQGVDQRLGVTKPVPPMMFTLWLYRSGSILA